MRGVQGAGGALAISTAAWMLRADAGGRTWAAIALAGAAAGPALGGALTQAFDWHAIFVAQVPVAVLAAGACVGAHWSGLPGAVGRGSVAASIALGLVSAALTAVLFLLVFVMIAGWSVEPLAAAAALTVLPLAGLASMRLPGGDALSRAAIGALLIAGGIAALAAMNTASLWWTVAPQAMAGAGMGLALPALSGAVGGAVRALTIRHIGITLALALLAPLIADRVEQSIQVTRERQVAALLDAPMSPLDKLRLAPRLVKGVDARDPRGALQAELERSAPADPAKRAAYDRYAEQVDATLVRGVDDAFRPIFWITAALALLAAVVLVPRPRPGLVYAGAAAVALPAVALLVALAVAPSVPKIQDPCHHRTEPAGLGVVERLANEALDRAACERGSSREQLVLDAAERVQRILNQGGIDAQGAAALVQQLLD
jgi:hypothetical protein